MRFVSDDAEPHSKPLRSFSKIIARLDESYEALMSVKISCDIKERALSPVLTCTFILCLEKSCSNVQLQTDQSDDVMIVESSVNASGCGVDFF